MLRFFIYNFVILTFRKRTENKLLIIINPLFIGIFLFLNEVNLLLNNNLHKK